MKTKRSILFYLNVAVILLVFSCKPEPKQSPPQVLKNKIAFVYDAENKEALEYKVLLEKNNAAVTLIDVKDLGNTNFTGYNLIVIGHNTDDGDDKWTDANAAILKNTAKPLMLMGQGGFLLGDKINTVINWGNSGTISDPVYGHKTVKIESSAPSGLLSNPNLIILQTGNILEYFSTSSASVAVYAGSVGNGIEIIGSFNNIPYLPILFDKNNKIGGFGFYGSISQLVV